MKAKLLAVLLLVASTDASAKYSVEPLLQQRLKMDGEIASRNKLLDQIGFTATSPDADALRIINSAELSIEYSLEAFETYLETLNALGKMASTGRLSDMRKSLDSICITQKDGIDVQSHQLEDQRIAKAIGIQLDNATKACDLSSGLEG